MQRTVALFGEAERGQCKTPHFLKQLPQLLDVLGNPPPESRGLYFAIQAILFHRDVIYFRVESEGFGEAEYLAGFKYLEDEAAIKHVDALCLPGVGDPHILQASQKVCHGRKAFVITTQRDLYDYLTS